MTLKTYIEELTELLGEVGDVDLYTAIDEEGNGYNKVCFSPGISYLSPYENQHRPDYLIPEKTSEEEYRHWLDENSLEEDEVKFLKKVILLN